MRIRILPEAEAELQAAREWYEGDRPGRGDRFADAVAEVFDDIAASPRRHPRLAHGRPDREFRSALVHRFPYSVHYLVLRDELIIFAVAHAKRRPGYWKRRQP